jgi:hypothetical protein
MAARRSNLASRIPADERPVPREAPSPRVVPAENADYAPRFSPARALQARLSEATNPTEADRWSPRATMLFVLGVCGAFWAAMGGTLMVVLR